MSEFELLKSICTSDNHVTAYNLYKNNRSHLSNYNIVIGSEFGADPGLSKNSILFQGFNVLNLFNNNKMLFLDKISIENLELYGNDSIELLPRLLLDSQTVRYIEAYIKGRLPKFKIIFDYLVTSKNYDINPYYFECVNKISDILVAREIEQTLYYYEIMDSIDLQLYLNTGIINSELSELEIQFKKNSDLDYIFNLKSDVNASAYLNNLYKTSYTLLLKMIDIQFNFGSSSTSNKILLFLEFLDTQIYKMCAREMILSVLYFQKKNNLRFFKEIVLHRDGKKILSSLKRMAWDTAHIRFAENNYIIGQGIGERYVIPSFLTNDSGLADIIQKIPLKSIAIDTISNKTYPFYSIDYFNLIRDYSIDSNSIYTKYFSVESISARRDKLGNEKSNYLDNIIEEYEDAILSK
jgi:hypothetical protein